MVLPFEPQPVSILRARLVAALAEPVDVLGLLAGHGARPGELRQHVLDCEDGMRLIVSRDRMLDDTVQIHLSASINQPSALWNALARQRKPVRRFILLAEQRWRTLGGPPVALYSLSDGKGVPHWLGREEGHAS